MICVASHEQQHFTCCKLTSAKRIQKRNTCSLLAESSSSPSSSSRSSRSSLLLLLLFLFFFKFFSTIFSCFHLSLYFFFYSQYMYGINVWFSSYSFIMPNMTVVMNFRLHQLLHARKNKTHIQFDG